MDAPGAASVAAAGGGRGRAGDGADIEYLADALLAPLTPDIWRHQRIVLGMSSERLAEGLLMLVPWS